MAVIFAGGEITDYKKIKQLLPADEYIICADGGLRHAQVLGFVPQLIVGDMDSVSPELLQHYQRQGAVVRRYSREKDEVDTELAIQQAVDCGQRQITLVGATGGRIDHTLANIHLLVKAVNLGVRAEMIDEYHRLSLITPEMPAELTGRPGKLLSLIPLTTEVVGVTSHGLKWDLNDRTFMIGQPFGVSNEFTADIADVSVKKGVLLCISIE